MTGIAQTGASSSVSFYDQMMQEVKKTENKPVDNNVKAYSNDGNNADIGKEGSAEKIYFIPDGASIDSSTNKNNSINNHILLQYHQPINNNESHLKFKLNEYGSPVLDQSGQPIPDENGGTVYNYSDSFGEPVEVNGSKFADTKGVNKFFDQVPTINSSEINENEYTAIAGDEKGNLLYAKIDQNGNVVQKNGKSHLVKVNSNNEAIKLLRGSVVKNYDSNLTGEKDQVNFLGTLTSEYEYELKENEAFVDLGTDDHDFDVKMVINLETQQAVKNDEGKPILIKQLSAEKSAAQMKRFIEAAPVLKLDENGMPTADFDIYERKDGKLLAQGAFYGSTKLLHSGAKWAMKGPPTVIKLAGKVFGKDLAKNSMKSIVARETSEAIVKSTTNATGKVIGKSIKNQMIKGVSNYSSKHATRLISGSKVSGNAISKGYSFLAQKSVKRMSNKAIKSGIEAGVKTGAKKVGVKTGSKIATKAAPAIGKAVGKSVPKLAAKTSAKVGGKLAALIPGAAFVTGAAVTAYSIYDFQDKMRDPEASTESKVLAGVTVGLDAVATVLTGSVIAAPVGWALTAVSMGTSFLSDYWR